MKKSTLFVIAAVAVMAASCCGGKEECSNGTVNATDATINTIMQRKSVRSYTSDTIAADVMEKLLRAAVAAPSGMDVRPWHIVVMTDKSQYDKLFEGNFNMEKFQQSAAVVIFCADTTVTRAPRGSLWPWRRMDGLLSFPRPYGPCGSLSQSARQHCALQHRSCWLSCRRRAAQGQVEPRAHTLQPLVMPVKA